MEKKLRLSPEEVLEEAVRAVRRARNHYDDVEFSPEAAVRSDVGTPATSVRWKTGWSESSGESPAESSAYREVFSRSSGI